MVELTIYQVTQRAIEAHKAGQVQEADRLYTAILKAQPKHPDANHNMGVLAVGVGKVEQALPFFKTALDANPAKAQFWLSYIDALIKVDKLVDAKAVLYKARSKGAKGDGFDTLEQRLKDAEKETQEASKITAETQSKQPNILDSVKLDQAIKLAKKKAKKGSTDEARHIYQDILAKFPKNKRARDGLKDLTSRPVSKASKIQDPPQDQVQALINLYSQGQLQEALQEAGTLIQKFPQSAILFNIQAAALKGLGQLDVSVEAYSKALAIKPNYAEAYYNMGVTLKGMVFKQSNPGLQKIIASLLDEKSFVRPRDIAPAAISLLKFEPKLKRHLQTSSVAEPEPKLSEVVTDLSELPLMLKLMSVCPLPDLDLEDLFRELRASLLLSISDLTGSAQELEFQSALALQCFTNEYIYNQSEREDEALAVLEVAVKQLLNKGEQPSPQSILCLASYRPLNQYDWSSSLRINDEIEDVFVRQIAEPNQESQIKTVLPMLEEITDKVSSTVRDQYEVSPYPRWVNLGLRLQAAPILTVVEEIKLKLCDDKIKEVSAPNILIAGCGTGQHSIGTAARFKGSKVLAIDLSLSSLSYAKRKTEELEIQNIDYMQADILDLGKLNRQFDIVESAGVLHHMHDPLAGWRVLTDCVKPGGLMKIGLYSELARKHIVEMRQEIKETGIGSSDAAMKSFRTTVIESDQKHHRRILNSSDFYSFSELKDLLFHVQEHRFTIPQIQNCLSRLGLKFCGFHSPEIISHFKLTNIGAGDPYDLDKWHAYEEANPSAFGGMYQFWCQKLA